MAERFKILHFWWVFLDSPLNFGPEKWDGITLFHIQKITIVLTPWDKYVHGVFNSVIRNSFGPKLSYQSTWINITLDIRSGDNLYELQERMERQTDQRVVLSSYSIVTSLSREKELVRIGRGKKLSLSEKERVGKCRVGKCPGGKLSWWEFVVKGYSPVGYRRMGYCRVGNFPGG